MFCRKCGTKNPDDARFCRNCGTPMSSGPSVNGGSSVNGGQNGNPTPPPMGQPGAMPRKPKGKRNGAMIAIVAVVVVALVASAYMHWSRKDIPDLRRNFWSRHMNCYRMNGTIHWEVI